MQKNRDVATTVRCDAELHEKCLKSAESAGQSLVEWIRRAMQEKLDRENNAQITSISESDFEDLLRRIEALERGATINQTNSGDRANLSIKVGGRR